MGIHVHQLVLGKVGDDIDHAPHRIRAVEGRGSAVEHLDTFDLPHVDTVDIHVARDISHHLLAVHQYEDILVAQSVHPQERPRGTGHERDIGCHTCENIRKGGCALFLYLPLRQHMHGCRR